MHFLRITNLEPSGSETGPVVEKVSADRARFETLRTDAFKEQPNAVIANLRDLGLAEGTHLWVQFDAARELESMEATNKAAEVWKHISESPECAAALRHYAAEKLKGGAGPDEAAQMDLSFALDITQDEEVRVSAVDSLTRAERVAELLSVVQTTKGSRFNQLFQITRAERCHKSSTRRGFTGSNRGTF